MDLNGNSRDKPLQIGYGAYRDRTGDLRLANPIDSPTRLTPSHRMGMTEPKLASTSDVARHRSTVVRSHGARTTAASGGNETSAAGGRK
jgi:hypothetical protein